MTVSQLMSIYPRCSMVLEYLPTFTIIYPTNGPNVGQYSRHGASPYPGILSSHHHIAINAIKYHHTRWRYSDEISYLVSPVCLAYSGVSYQMDPNMIYVLDYIRGVPYSHGDPQNSFRFFRNPLKKCPDAPWCWNIYLHLPRKNDPVLKVNIRAPWSIWDG